MCPVYFYFFIGTDRYDLFSYIYGFLCYLQIFSPILLIRL